MEPAKMDTEGAEIIHDAVKCSHPHLVYCSGQSELKGEDVLFVEHSRPWPGSDRTESSVLSARSGGGEDTGSTADLDSANSFRGLPEEFSPCCPDCLTDTSRYSLFCVFDGHNGVHAAKMCGEAVLPLLESRLPLGCPPPSGHELYSRWCEMVQLAMVETMTELNRLFAQRGMHAGATATIVLQHGWLLTTVNLGDSRAVLDTGSDSIPLTGEHRVASNKGERRRVEAMGAIVAPVSMAGSGPADDYNNGVGPLRIWPGGLCLSRAIGDFDVGESVLPFPHLTQVQLPPTGGRLLVASDGVWDAFDKMSRAGTMSRGWSTEVAPSRMIQTIVRAYGGLKDDTTLVVADILPPGTTFQQMAAASKKGGSSVGGSVHGYSNGIGGSSNGGGGGFCSCFGGPSPTIDAPLKASLDTNASVRSGASTNPSVSVRSGAAYANGSVRNGNPKPLAVQMIANLDVAAVMGLMPEVELETPGWYNPAVGEQLFRSAAEADETWRSMQARRYARPPATPSIPAPAKQRRRSSGRKSVAFSKEATQAAEDNAAARAAAAVAAAQTPSMMRNASVHFGASVTDGEEAYGQKFGHYRAAPGADASVRAGRVYNSEASVRAGTAGLGGAGAQRDPSIRIAGSDMDKSVHVRSSALGAEAGGLRPVRVVKREGPGTRDSAGPVSRPIEVPVARTEDALGFPADSATEQMALHKLASVAE